MHKIFLVFVTNGSLEITCPPVGVNTKNIHIIVLISNEYLHSNHNKNNSVMNIITLNTFSILAREPGSSLLENLIVTG